jgi:hypothetical protein
MSDPDLELSLAAGGQHHLLGRMAGRWRGIARTWFEPGKLSDESPIRGTIRPVLGGRFVVHEYEGTMQGEPLAGIAIHGYDLAKNEFTTAWVDSFHNGTGIMLSQSAGAGRGDGFSVLGSYGAEDARWGWRTEVALPEEAKLTISHYNITPAGDEAKGVEILYEREP